MEKSWKTENGMLRKEVDDIFEVANMREKECNRLKEERVGLEKRIHQFQAIQDVATQSKAVIDHEMAKIKVNICFFLDIQFFTRDLR